MGLLVPTPSPWGIEQPHLCGTSPPSSGDLPAMVLYVISAQAPQCFVGLA